MHDIFCWLILAKVGPETEVNGVVNSKDIGQPGCHFVNPEAQVTSFETVDSRWNFSMWTQTIKIRLKLICGQFTVKMCNAINMCHTVLVYAMLLISRPTFVF